jgi:2-polyprenyl-3-methyl-5-hydroxy-6-metoxy-1,4-benzoquinol methylase
MERVAILEDERGCPLCDDFSPSRVLTQESLDLDTINEFTFSSRKKPDNMRYKMVVCLNCDLAYAKRVPTFEWLRSNYVNASFDTGLESRHAAVNHASILDRIISKLPDFNGALDIGAGDGAFCSELLQRRFTNVVGVEPSLEPIQSAPKEVKEHLIQEFFDGRNYQSNTYSVVSCFQALEHIDDIRFLMESAYRLLKPGGYFIVSCHDYRAWTAKLLGAKSPIFDIEHLQLFSKLSLKNLYLKYGFTDVAVGTITNRYPIAYWLKLSPIPENIKVAVSKVISCSGLAHLSLPFPAGNLWAFGAKAE